MSWQQGLKIPTINFDIDDESELNAPGDKDQQLTISSRSPSSSLPQAVPLNFIPATQFQKKTSSFVSEKRWAEQQLQKDSLKKSKHSHKEKHNSGHAPEKGKGKGKGKGKDVIRRASNDLFTLELSKGLAALSKEDSLEFVRSLHTLDDNFFYSKFTPE
ncbi:hypothetical protein ACS0TY_016365 [Phlomoides rotata]